MLGYVGFAGGLQAFDSGLASCYPTVPQPSGNSKSGHRKLPPSAERQTISNLPKLNKTKFTAKASRLEAIDIRLEVIASRVEASASRLEAITVSKPKLASS